jgi:archaellum component FlaC
MKAKRSRKSKSEFETKPSRKPIRFAQVPATAAMLYEMEGRLTHAMKAEIHGVKAEIQGVKSEMEGMKSEIHAVKSGMDGMKSEIHRVGLLVEEQNARNKFVMDGYAQIYELLTERVAGG